MAGTFNFVEIQGYESSAVSGDFLYGPIRDAGVALEVLGLVKTQCGQDRRQLAIVYS